MLKAYFGFHDALLRSVDASNPRAIVLTLGYPDQPAEVVVFESADDLRYWGEGPSGYHVIGRICLIEHLKEEPPHIGVRPEQWREILEVVRSEQLGDWCIIIRPHRGSHDRDSR